MKTEGNDWVFLRLSAEELKEYLLSEQMFWQLSPEKDRFTIGNLLLAEKKLSASLLTSDEKSRLTEQMNVYGEVRSVWRANWNEKAKKEWLTRFNLWKQYIADLRKERGNWSWNYSSEVRNRVILEMLESEMGSIDLENKSNLNSLDHLLKTFSRESNFIWEESCEPAFPKNEFWFLYRSI